MTIMKYLTAVFAITTTVVASHAAAHPHSSDDPNQTAHPGGYHVHENGIGSDPDGDSNPATITGGVSLAGDEPVNASDNVLSFEVIRDQVAPKPGEDIAASYQESHGVIFGPGLSRQQCTSQQQFRQMSICTYEAAPSGKYAAGYGNHLNRPLTVEFDDPACIITMAIYPTGGKEDEPFELTIEGWNDSGTKLPTVKVDFNWTDHTMRWRHMAGAYYLGDEAKKISIGMRSKDGKEARKMLRFLIDDFSFTNDKCAETLAAFKKAQEGEGGDVEMAVENDGALAVSSN